MAITLDHLAFLKLLQLASPALPVGAFSYSEGLEALVYQGSMRTLPALEDWLVQELRYGAVRLEAAIAIRIHRQLLQPDPDPPTQLAYWNQWLSATRETTEMRQQSWQMGRALSRLLENLHPELCPTLTACGIPCNFAVVFAIAAAHWQLSAESLTLAYLQSWATNLVNAAIKLIPLGQTDGQALLLKIYPEISETTICLQNLADDPLTTSSWGPALASMSHETLYSRLFRS